jgi:hypothetical protein
MAHGRERALIATAAPADDEPDPLGEGVIIITPRRRFSRLRSTARPRAGAGRRAVAKRARAPGPAPTHDEPLGRDRCTIVLTHGDPAGALERSGRRACQHVVPSDTSQESRHAVEWRIGTVIRDGDEMPVVNKNENENEAKSTCPLSRHDAVLTAVQSAPARVPRSLIARRRSAASRRYVAALDHFAYTHSLVHAALVRQATGFR